MRKVRKAEPSRWQSGGASAHSPSYSTQWLRKLASEGMGEIHAHTLAAEKLFRTQEENFEVDPHVVGIEDVTRGLGLEPEDAERIQRLVQDTNPEFKAKSQTQRLFHARGRLLDTMKHSMKHVPSDLREQVLKRALQFWKKTYQTDYGKDATLRWDGAGNTMKSTRFVIPLDLLKSSKGSEKAGHKYKSRKPNGKGGFDYVYEHHSGGEMRVSTGLDSVQPNRLAGYEAQSEHSAHGSQKLSGVVGQMGVHAWPGQDPGEASRSYLEHALRDTHAEHGKKGPAAPHDFTSDEPSTIGGFKPKKAAPRSQARDQEASLGEALDERNAKRGKDVTDHLRRVLGFRREANGAFWDAPESFKVDQAKIDTLSPSDWKHAIAHATSKGDHFSAEQFRIALSGQIARGKFAANRVEDLAHLAASGMRKRYGNPVANDVVDQMLRAHAEHKAKKALTIPASLFKAEKGAEKAGHLYTKRIPDGKGGWHYDYGPNLTRHLDKVKLHGEKQDVHSAHITNRGKVVTKTHPEFSSKDHERAAASHHDAAKRAGEHSQTAEDKTERDGAFWAHRRHLVAAQGHEQAAKTVKGREKRSAAAQRKYDKAREPINEAGRKAKAVADAKHNQALRDKREGKVIKLPGLAQPKDDAAAAKVEHVTIAQRGMHDGGGYRIKIGSEHEEALKDHPSWKMIKDKTFHDHGSAMDAAQRVFRHTKTVG